MELTAKQIKFVLMNTVGGFNKSYSVSIRIGTIAVRINDWYISKSEVEKVLSKYETINRCSETGDILLGGTNLIIVSYSAKVPTDLVDSLEVYARPVVFEDKHQKHDKINIFARFLFEKKLFEWLKLEDVRSLIVHTMEQSQQLRRVLS